MHGYIQIISKLNQNITTRSLPTFARFDCYSHCRKQMSDFLNEMFKKAIKIFVILTLSSPGFFGSSQPWGEGGGQSAPHYNFFVIGRIMMKLGKLVKCFKIYLMMGFWWVNWL